MLAVCITVRVRCEHAFGKDGLHSMHHAAGLVGGGRVGGRGLEASSACIAEAHMTCLTVGNRAAPPIGANAVLELELLTNSTVRG